MRLFVLLLGGGLSLTAAASPVPHAPCQTPPDEVPVGADYQPIAFRGRVASLSAKGLIIAPQGHLKLSASISYHPDRTVKEKKVYIQDNTQPPRAFVFAPGLVPPAGIVPRGHMVSDLQDGDIVQIEWCREGGRDFCTGIKIHRRPGGTVPPTAEDKRLITLGMKLGENFDRHRWDYAANAEQARDDSCMRVLSRLFIRFHP